MKKPDVQRPVDGDEVEVKHASGTYRGTVREPGENGFMLYSEGNKAGRTVGVYFSWDSVTCEEVGAVKATANAAVCYGESEDEPAVESTGNAGPATLGVLRRA